MQHNQVLQQILQRLDSPDRVALLFTADEVGAWPWDALEALKQQSIIKPAKPANVVECPGCEEACLMPVQVISGDGVRPARVFIVCDKRKDTGRIPIDHVTLQRWQIVVEHLVRELASAMVTDQNPEEIIAGRVYYLGAITLNRKKRSAFFICNTKEAALANDSPFNTSMVDQFPNPFFLIADSQAGPSVQKHGDIISLRQVMSMGTAGLSLDLEELNRLIAKVERHVSHENKTENIFRRVGQMWKISFAGKTVHLKDSKGLEYIFFLLGSP